MTLISTHLHDAATATDAAAELNAAAPSRTRSASAGHDHHGRFGHVDADLDHRRGDECVELALLERAHHAVARGRIEPAVHEPDAQLRHRIGELARDGRRGFEGLFRLVAAGRRRVVDFPEQANDIGALAQPIFARSATTLYAAASPRLPVRELGRRSIGGVQAGQLRRGSTRRGRRSCPGENASVRGISVAVITSRCGAPWPSPLSRSFARCCDGMKRCCSSITTSP